MESTQRIGPFVKSKRSGQNDNCVEVAPLAGGGRALRDSKVVGGPEVDFSSEGWNAFAAELKAGGFTA